MKLLFVKSPMIGSRIIRWGLDEPVSHVIVSFDVDKMPVMFHSYGSGLTRLYADEFEKHRYEIVDLVELPLIFSQELAARKEFEASTGYQKYDYLALAYFSWRVFLKKFFKKPLPDVNRWGFSDYDLCTEAVYLVAEIYAKITAKMILPPARDLGIVSPWELCGLLRERLKALCLN